MATASAPADAVTGQKETIGGYDANFCVELDEDYMCSICMLAFREPHQIVACGHQYCKSCLDSCKQTQGGEFRCPQDRQLIDIDKVFPNVASERKILSLKVKCNSEKDGCEWGGELRSLKDHIATCQFHEIRCINDGCQSFHQRRFLVDHLQECAFRIVKCAYCDEKHISKDEKEHQENCTGIPAECGNGCGKVIPKIEMRNHLANDCPLETVSCTYLTVGCQHKCQRDKKEDHEKSEVASHLNLAMNRIHVIESRLEQGNNICIPADKRGIVTYIWKLENFQQTVEELRTSENFRHSKHYLTSEYGYEVRLKAKIFSPEIYFQGQWSYNECVAVELEILKGSYDDLLKWPFSYKYTLAFVHKDDNRPNIQRTKSALMAPIEEIQRKGFIVNDTMFIKLELHTNDK